MNSSQNEPRRKRGRDFSIEKLEERQLLSAGQGSTFAIMPGAVATAGKVSTVQFKIDPSQFTGGRGGRILLGIDVAATSGSTVAPEVVAVKDARGRNAGPIIRSVYTPQIIKAQKLKNPMTSAVLVRLQVPKAGHGPATYTVQIAGASRTTGNYLVGFYLPGDVAGTGKVMQTDLQTISSDLGATPTSSKYSFDADVNRDGRISATDLAFAAMNMGAKTTISPIISVNLDPTTDGPLKNRVTSSNPVRFTGVVTPNATVAFTEASGKSTGAVATADGSGDYSINVPLGDGSNTFKVTTTDAFGQVISGQIAPVTYTTNPPQAVTSPSQLAELMQSSSTSTTT